MHTEPLNLLNVIYNNAHWLAQDDWACHEGCSSCCTQSVSMTTLEGTLIVDFIADKADPSIRERLNSAAVNAGKPSLTTNDFAKKCLAMEGVDEEEEYESWNFNPCVFLNKSKSCSIYPVRPFNCRCFLSSSPCQDQGYARVEPLIITLNSLYLQIIEHVDQGGYWGNMNEVLYYLLKKNQEPDTDPARFKLLPCRPSPGFLIPPEEKEEVLKSLNRLFQSNINGISFRKHVDAISEIIV